MNLLDIQDPSDIKNLSIKELNDLASQIRKFLIQSISETGGHLASNLGVVELTIALHYVFNSPEDKIFFDVGHQCYTHKILTGRAKSFPTLRRFHGMSGFEKRSESEHDVWEAGHSSTSLSAALGMAVARDLDHKDYQVVPVIGDGALGSGMALEALNEIGEEKRKMVIIFNDNNMSISRNVGAMAKSFSNLRASNGYNNFKDGLKENLSKNDLGKSIYSGLKSFKNSLKDSLIDKGIFGTFNLEYMGPVDGHNIHDLIQVLKVAKKYDGPVVVHVITKKGKGYKYCENDTEGKWHGVGPFNPETGKPLSSVPEGYEKWASVYSDTVLELAEKDQDITVLTPAMIQGSSLQRFFAKYPDRSFDCGITEEHAMTFAAGLAISGKRPYIPVYSSFLQRAYDQINHDICRMDLPVVIGIDHAGLVGDDGETHHGIYDIGLLRPLPYMILAQPKDADEARDLLYTAFHQDHPFALRYPKGVVKAPHKNLMHKVKVGSWEKIAVTDHDKVLIFTYGPAVNTVYDKLRNNQIPATVINCRFFKPMDEEMLEELVHTGMPAVIYENDMLAGGLGEEILAWLCDRGYTMKIKRLGIGDQYVQQGAETRLRKELHIDLNTLIDEVEKLMLIPKDQS